jgi:hypothetical protein
MDDPEHDVGSDLSKLLEQLEALVKEPTFTLRLGAKGINSSLLLVAVQGLRAYVLGRKIEAAEDFETVAEEIRARIDQKH